MASHTEEDSQSQESRQALTRKSSRTITLSLKAKENKLSKLNAQIIALILGKLKTHEKMSISLPSCSDDEVLNKMLYDLEENNSDILTLYEEILDLSNNQPASEVGDAYQQYEANRLATKDEVNKRLEHLNMEYQKLFQENLALLNSHNRRSPYSRSPLPSIVHSVQSFESLRAPVLSHTPSNENVSKSSNASSQSSESISTLPSKAESTAMIIAETIAKSIAQSMRAARLVEPPPEVFRGDSLKFEDWLCGFDAYVEGKGFTDAEKMRFLKRYVGGEVENLIGSYCTSRNVRSYAKAREELQKRYGDPHRLTDNYREKLEGWRKIGLNDKSELRRFTDYLIQCMNAMDGLPGLSSLNDYKEIRKLKEKLPSWLSTRWGREVHRIKKSKFTEPNFKDFVNFLSEEVEILFDPYNETEVLSVKTESRRPEKRSNDLRTRSFEVKRQTDNFRHCTYCNRQNHEINKCFDFLEIPVNDRWMFARSNQLCYCCLKSSHRSTECKQSPCTACGKKHANCLHKKPKTSLIPSSEDPIERTVVPISSKISNHSERGGILSMILPVYIKAHNAAEVLVYAMLDTQSDACFVTKDVARKLASRGSKEFVTLSTLTETRRICTSKHKLSVRGYFSPDSIELQAYEQNMIPCNKQQIPNDRHATEFEHLKSLALELPPLLDIPIGLLIGIDCGAAFIPLKTIVGQKRNEPFAIKTVLGWTLCGGDASKGTKAAKHSNRIQVCDVLSALEPKFGEENHLELLSQDNIKFLKILEGGISRDNSGFLTMPLPFKHHPQLPYNRDNVKKRLESLQRRFNAEVKYKNDYDQFMRNMMLANDAELVPENELKGKPGQVWYLPHFGTYHARKPEKIRVVFDCSAKYFGKTLNEHLLSGPDMLNTLAGILCRFRKETIAISCDIQSMFNRFKVHEADRDYLRFLWYDNQGRVADYRMTTHLFGAVSSPGCATFGLRKLADEFVTKYPNAAKFIKDNFYVDDGLVSVPDIDSGKSLVREAREICEAGNLRLHKFMSNEPLVLEELPASERDQTMSDLELAVGYTLGVKWNMSNDTFSFAACKLSKPHTRRGVLSTVASIFDPLGWISPFTLQGKQILQETCRSSSEWDEPLGPVLKSRWVDWISDAQQIDSIYIDRCLKPKAPSSRVVRQELHHFCDGSETGYGACSYLKQYTSSSEIHCSLLFGKARVAPIKILTIPRLELQAAVLVSDMHRFIVSELDISIDQVYFWTDSKIVLGYIKNEEKRFKIFVANRVQHIRNNSSCEMWNYVPSELNPADIASRGCTLQELKTSQWYEGPKFLWETSTSMKFTSEPYVVHASDSELRVLKVGSSHCNVSLTERFEKFSSWKTLVRGLSILRSMVKRRSWKHESPNVEEFMKTESFIIARVQYEAFSCEIKALQMSKDLPLSSSLIKLSPYIEEGILRVGGRAHSSVVMLSEAEKHPIILPRDSHVTFLIARHYHEKSQHQGKSMAVGLIRQAGYWIMGCSGVVSRMLQGCVVCKRLRGKNCVQYMGNLPVERLEPSPPFTHIGIDCFGPFLVKDRRSQVKRWGLLATCLYSRAVHLEVLEDMSTDSFICALRRIISIRGPVRTIYCDRGTNFVGADNELNRKPVHLEAKLKAYLLENKCVFRFNSPSASHMGGVFERQIKTVKTILANIFMKHESRLDTCALRTALYEVMAIINSRPLSVEDLHDPTGTVITPNHLLTGKTFDGYRLSTQPAIQVSSEDIYGRKRWLQAQVVAEEFWNAWKHLYLININVRQKWTTKSRNLQVGDIVIVNEPDIPRGLWKIGVVDQVFHSKDGLIRKASVRIGNKKLDHDGIPNGESTVLERPIHKLVLLLPRQDLAM